jgi:hypothetical protein
MSKLVAEGYNEINKVAGIHRYLKLGGTADYLKKFVPV